MAAAMYGYGEVIRLLLEAGATVNVTTPVIMYLSTFSTAA